MGTTGRVVGAPAPPCGEGAWRAPDFTTTKMSVSNVAKANWLNKTQSTLKTESQVERCAMPNRRRGFNATRKRIHNID
jgi:hypothetical protein